MMARCRVRSEDHEVEVLMDEDGMSIEDMMTQAREQLDVQSDRGSHTAPTSLPPVRHERGLEESKVDERTVVSVKRDDLLEGDPRLATGTLHRRVITNVAKSHSESSSTRANASVKSVLLDKASFSRREKAIAEDAVPPGLPGCRLGIFTITPLKAENPPLTSRFRLPRISLSVKLLPYEDERTTRTAHGPDFAWAPSLSFTHFDPTRTGLIIQLSMFDEPLLGSRTLIGRSYVSLEDALDAPGTPLLRWSRVDPVSQGSAQSVSPTDSYSNGRILISVCFHPKVSKGPTVQALLHSIAHADVNPSSSGSIHTSRRAQSSQVRAMLDKLRRRNEMRAVEAAALNATHSLRRIKGSFTFELRGMHFCGEQCSILDGHSSVSLPEFHPIVLVRFDDFEEEIRASAEGSDNLSFVREWPVYSSFSKVEVEVYRRATLCTGSADRRQLSDGSAAVRVACVGISCFEIQERVAASWTLDQLETISGPANQTPERGFQWYPLMMGEEEVGLANIAAHYSEDLLSLVDGDESPDLAFVPSDERDFDAAIVQRNFERLDDLVLALKESKSYWDETLDWKSPLRSAFAWVFINGFFFQVSAEYLPLFVTLVIIGVLSKTFVAFLRGDTHKKWIEHNPSASRLKMFRPIATLRFAPTHASHLLPVVGEDDHPDSFVRIFYEPNYKKIPVRQIAVTECARRTQNPEWSSPQRGSIRDDFLRRNNSRLKDMMRHMSAHVQDAVLHDVVEPWQRKDGIVDVNAFRLSMLQAVKMDEATGDDVLIEWRKSPGTIRFDVMQECLSDSTILIGRVRVPTRSLITDESAGGPQSEFELTLPLAQPPRHTAHSPRTQPDNHNSGFPRTIATITVRMQMILRNPSDRITLRDNLASEALYEAFEMEVERELSWVAKYHKAKDVAKNFQQALSLVCGTLERFKNLFLWVHPAKTLLVLVLSLLGCICFYVVPVRYWVLYSSSKAFTRKFHKSIDRDLVRFRNLLVSIPSDLDMKTIYRWRNGEFLKAKEHSEAHARLQAHWSGLVLRQRFAWLQSWQERYGAIRGGRLEFWHSIADAKAGLPPRHSYHISNTLDACTKAELTDVPRDCYPVVVFDVSPSILSLSPRGRRRIVCLKSQDALHEFSDAVRSSGEPIHHQGDETTSAGI